MKNQQAEIWNRLLANLEQYGGGLYESCRGSRMAETEKIFDKMCEDFGATLSKDQQEIFYRLVDLATMLNSEYEEAGMALGFRLAGELRKLLDYPAVAFQQASTMYPTVTQSQVRDGRARSLPRKAQGGEWHMPFDEMKRTIDDIDEVAILARNRRIMEKRVETGCYAEDGLYRRKPLSPPLTMAYLFVDDSSLLFNASEGLVYHGMVPIDAPNIPTMAETWLRACDMDELRELMRKEASTVDD